VIAACPRRRRTVPPENMVRQVSNPPAPTRQNATVTAASPDYSRRSAFPGRRTSANGRLESLTCARGPHDGRIRSVERIVIRWVDDSVGDCTTPEPSQRVRSDVFRHSFRDSEIVCHGGHLAGTIWPNRPMAQIDRRIESLPSALMLSYNFLTHSI
jgi:hypothetical protein